MNALLGLRTQFILITFLCIACTIGLTGYTVIKRERGMLEENLERQGLMLGKSSAILFTNAFVYEELDLIESSGMANYLEYYVADIMTMDPRIVSFLVFDNNDRVVTHNDLRLYGTFLHNGGLEILQSSEGPVVRKIEQGGQQFLEVLVPLAIESRRWGGCRLLFSLTEITEETQALRMEVLRASGISLLLCLVLIGVAADYFIKPLKKLSLAMEQITIGGDVHHPVPEFSQRKDEIGQLQHSFHWMTNRLRDEERNRIQTFEKLAHTEKMATVGQLTASIAHEINNPLGGVILCFHNLVEGRLDGSQKKQHIDVINASLKRMQETMRDLLDYSRQTELSMRRASISETIDQSLALIEVMMRRNKVTLLRNLPAAMPKVHLDPIKMQQVIVNIAVNAIHAMAGGGTLSIGGSYDEDSVTITLTDTGPGVPVEIREKIFDPFFTTKELGRGTGLGLALSRSIVEEHGGQLQLLRSGPSGSSFSITLRHTGVDNEE